MTKLQRDVEEALDHGARKIDELRRQNELLGIKADAYDTMSRLMRLLVPPAGQGYEMDAAYQMRMVLNEYRAANSESAETLASVKE